MGVTINYRGHINAKENIQKFINEVSDICQSMDWDYNILDENWEKPSKLKVEHTEEGVSLQGHAGLKGVTFRPHEECEPVRLTFDAKGQLNSVMNLAFGIHNEEGGNPWNFTKTQFAGVETHISIVKLLKYLKKKYINDLEVNDEGNYWESEDEKEVTSRMNMIDNAMNALQEGLQVLGDLDGLTEEMILKKIEDVIENIGEQEGIQVKVMRIDSVLKNLEDIDPEILDDMEELLGDAEDFKEELGNFLKGNIQNRIEVEPGFGDIEYFPSDEEFEEEDDEEDYDFEDDDEMPF